MMRTAFRAHAIATSVYGHISTGGLDHVFVTSSEGHDWGCFGRGADYIAQARVIAEGAGIAEWADLINGTDANSPTGITNFIDGTCHCVANRLLVLAGTDVSAAKGNELVILLYGKYGFRIQEYVARVQSAAAEVNQKAPGAISDAEVEAVVSRITGSLSDELLLLKEDFESRVMLKLNGLDVSQKSNMRRIYTDFHAKREEAHAGIDRTRRPEDAQTDYIAQMKPLVVQCLRNMLDTLGSELYGKVFTVSPEQAVAFLLGNL